MADVFISYARDDQASARRLSKALQARGYDVWWDADLPVHRSYSEVIERSLEEARAVVVLWSNAAAKSQWVRAEAEHARTHGKLVQAQLDDGLPPMPFNQIQCASLAGWKGRPTHSGLVKLEASIAALVGGGDNPPLEVRSRATTTTTTAATPRPRVYLWLAVATIMLLIVGAGWFGLRPNAPQRKPVVAILPFESVDPKDEALAAGMWEDTRQAVGHNPQLIVLGPNSAQELAKKDPSATKRAADYLVQANIRTAGNRIRITTTLVRTKDGSQMWSDSFDRQLNDVFALQSDIAQQIEGRIRGRLAENGGKRAENIATSGDVYALYSDARAKVSQSNPNNDPMATFNDLQRVVKMDPNFAPGWAALSLATHQIWASDVAFNTDDASEDYARRAIELAPNLAASHAALARALKLRGPVANAEIKRAIALDPSDFESLLVLGDVYLEQGRTNDALEAYSRVIAIEPLWWPALLRKLDIVLSRNDFAAAKVELDRVHRLGSRDLEAMVGIQTAYARNDLSKAARIGISFWNSSVPGERGVVANLIAAILLQLGYVDEAQRASHLPPIAPVLMANNPKGLDMIELMHYEPRKFFSMMPMPATAGRVYLLSGRGDKLAEIYQSLNLTPAQFEQLIGPGQPFMLVAPIIAVALRTRNPTAAARLLNMAENEATSGPDRSSVIQSALLARIYAAQGRGDAALGKLADAVNRGWLPAPPELLTDIATDPTFGELRNDPRFRRIREQILNRIRRERTELGPVNLK
ncbi:MAG: TIR domain-containing protein [Sphingomicrobium sp.]